MICVSYTRVFPNCPAMEEEDDTIRTQNETIRSFLKSKKDWRLQKRYSDRKRDKNDETAFLQMKRDGMKREFDCVVFSSLFFCGRRLQSVSDLLRKVFCPAGIFFAVAEDGFCSCDATPEEIEQYLKSYKTKHYQRSALRMSSGHFDGTAYRKYGYIRMDADQLVIDPEPAKTIQRVYAEFCMGRTEKEIAEQLNEEGVESPNRYRWKFTGTKNRQQCSIWQVKVIEGILQDETYTGKWTIRLRNILLEQSCPVIIEKTTYDQVQERIRMLQKEDYRRFHTPRGTFTLCPGKVFDEETKWPLSMGKRGTEKVYRFKYPAPSIRMYDKLYIEPDIINSAVLAGLERERRKALIALERLNMPEAKMRLEEQIKPLCDEAFAMYQKMIQTEQAYIELAKQGTEDVRARCNEMLTIQEEQDQVLQEILDRMERTEKCFSNKNPWVALYAEYDPQKTFSAKTDRKYVGKILVHRFEYAYLVPKEREWFLSLPQEWFTEV